MAIDSNGNDFAKTFKELVFDTDPLNVLNGFSVNGVGRNGSDTSPEIEAASLALLLNGANDIHPPKRAKTFGGHKEALYLQEVKLAAVRTNHFDIVPKDLRGGATSDQFPLMADVCDKTKQTQVVANDEADDDNLFDGEAWIETRLTGLRECLESGAQIICMGEFDYPPQVAGDRFAREFDEKIIATINAPNVKQSVFLVAGSRHETNSETEEGRYTSNRAKIFVNKVLDQRGELRASELQFPIDHLKLVSAEKVGERLEAVSEPRLCYYDTQLGRIGVLICVDAYSPNVILSLINNRNVQSEHKLDYLLVPSYNMSQHFNYVCQILSLACETTVLLVDACRHSSRKRTGAGLFVGGRMFSDIVASTRENDETPVGRIIAGLPADDAISDPYVRVWELNLDYVRAQHLGKFLSTPFLKSVDPFLTHLKNLEKRSRERG